MAETKKDTLIQVDDRDRLRLKKIAEDEDRTMKVMFRMMLDFWEKKNA